MRPDCPTQQRGVQLDIRMPSHYGPRLPVGQLTSDEARRPAPATSIRERSYARDAEYLNAGCGAGVEPAARARGGDPRSCQELAGAVTADSYVGSPAPAHRALHGARHPFLVPGCGAGNRTRLGRIMSPPRSLITPRSAQGPVARAQGHRVPETRFSRATGRVVCQMRRGAGCRTHDAVPALPRRWSRGVIRDLPLGPGATSCDFGSGLPSDKATLPPPAVRVKRRVSGAYCA